MKKTYQTPVAEVIRIETTQMLAASGTIGFGDTVNTAAGAESREIFLEGEF